MVEHHAVVLRRARTVSLGGCSEPRIEPEAVFGMAATPPAGATPPNGSWPRANVLDGPLHALHHFLVALRDCPGAPDLQPGDVVTTGTWTDAWPVAAGEQWRAVFDSPLSPLEIEFR